MEQYEYKDEIISTRKGGLGGSDGNLLYQIEKLGHVPPSCMERLAIVKGLYENADNNVSTNAMQIGDSIENQIFDILHSQNCKWQSNPYTESKKYSRKNCKLFCHIDFMLIDDVQKVITFVECKATNKSKSETKQTYINQLFVEYFLGRELLTQYDKSWKFSLKLCHYNTENYNGDFIDLEKIEMENIRFKKPLFSISKAMDIIDDYLENLTDYYKEEITEEYLPVKIKEKFDTVSMILKEIKEKENSISEFKNKMFDFMVDKNIKSIKTSNFIITRVDSSEKISFNSTKFREEHKEEYDKYIKISPTKGYVLLKLKNNDN